MAAVTAPTARLLGDGDHPARDLIRARLRCDVGDTVTSTPGSPP